MEKEPNHNLKENWQKNSLESHIWFWTNALDPEPNLNWRGNWQKNFVESYISFQNDISYVTMTTSIAAQ